MDVVVVVGWGGGRDTAFGEGEGKKRFLGVNHGFTASCRPKNPPLSCLYSRLSIEPTTFYSSSKFFMPGIFFWNTTIFMSPAARSPTTAASHASH